MKTQLTVISLTLALMFSCSTADQSAQKETMQPPPDTAAIRQAGQARFEAAAAGDTGRYLAAYADDAIWMPPAAEEIVGKAAARQRMEGVLAEVEIEMDTTTDEEMVLSPDWVLDRGSYAMTRTPRDGGEPEDVVGSYLTLWHRDSDGSWKIAFDIWNSDRPLTADAQ